MRVSIAGTMATIIKNLSTAFLIERMSLALLLSIFKVEKIIVITVAVTKKANRKKYKLVLNRKSSNLLFLILNRIIN
jgi:uncharacterized Tic20 family protein